MAKALLGHIDTPTARLLEENVALRARVRALQTEVARLRAERELLVADGLSELRTEHGRAHVGAPA